MIHVFDFHFVLLQIVLFFSHDMVMRHDVMIYDHIMLYHTAHFVPCSSRIHLQHSSVELPVGCETLPVPLAKIHDRNSYNGMDENGILLF